MLRKCSVAARLAVGFSVMAVIVLLLGVLANREMAEMRKQAEAVETYWLPSIQLTNGFAQDLMQVRDYTLRAMLTDSEDYVTQIRQLAGQIEALNASLRAGQQRYAQMLIGDDERRLYEAFHDQQEHFFHQQAELMQMVHEGRHDLAQEHLNTLLNPQTDRVIQALRTLEQQNISGAAAASENSASNYQVARNMVMFAMLLAVLLTVALAWTLSRSIIQPIRQALEVAEIVAAGDLTQRIEVAGGDEPGRLLQALARMQEQLRSTIAGIANSSLQLSAAAEQLHAVTEDSSRVLQHQGDEVQQAAIAVSKMAAAVKDVASRAASTSDQSLQATRITGEGRQQVDRTLASIGKLTQNIVSSADEVQALASRGQGISQVLDVIRTIAEQTNLLALNAAIEAARAGDAGRGFAVVADEVRALAHRTQESTSEIEDMIVAVQQGSERAAEAMRVSRVMSDDTQEQADAAGQVLSRISEVVQQINERNLVIAQTAEDQAQMAKTVDHNLDNIRDLSAQSSAGAEQSNAASRELSSLAIELNTLISHFRV